MANLMGKIVLITGGTRSGKSSFGEKLLEKEENILYIATAKITDEDMARRVIMHKERRGVAYRTVEAHKNIDKVITESAEKVMILECVGTLITNLLFDQKVDDSENTLMSDSLGIDFDTMPLLDVKKSEEKIMKYLKKIIKAVHNSGKYCIIITNEVGFALVSEYRLGRIFTDILGRANQIIAKEADEVYLMVSGLPIVVKK